jgi:hypothetical protein
MYKVILVLVAISLVQSPCNNADSNGAACIHRCYKDSSTVVDDGSCRCLRKYHPIGCVCPEVKLGEYHREECLWHKRQQDCQSISQNTTENPCKCNSTYHPTNCTCSPVSHPEDCFCEVHPWSLNNLNACRATKTCTEGNFTRPKPIGCTPADCQSPS